MKINVLALYFAVSLWKQQELTGLNWKYWKQPVPPKRVKRSNYASHSAFCWAEFTQTGLKLIVLVKMLSVKGKQSIDFTELT